MHRFVRGGKKLLERKIGIFGGMDVRMGSMLFFFFVFVDAFLSTHYNAFFKNFLTIFPTSTYERLSHAYKDIGEERTNTLITKSNYTYKDPPKK